jgi:hypothetical protein
MFGGRAQAARVVLRLTGASCGGDAFSLHFVCVLVAGVRGRAKMKCCEMGQAEGLGRTKHLQLGFDGPWLETRLLHGA